MIRDDKNQQPKADRVADKPAGVREGAIRPDKTLAKPLEEVAEEKDKLIPGNRAAIRPD